MAKAATIDSKSTWRDAKEQCYRWLALGLADFKSRPLFALGYGFGFVLASYAVLAVLWFFSLGWMLLPALAGAILVGPILAVGLYQEARRMQFGRKGAIASPGQFAMVGTILMILLLMWFRTAVVLYAIAFGLKPFPGLVESILTLTSSVEGLSLLIAGTVIGGLFAALTLSVSFFSVPMLVDKEVDGFTAMGRSFLTCLQNFKLAVYWGFLVTMGLVVGFATGLLALIVIFPLLGFSTWHAYDELFSANPPK
jgi:uncharacterized membrane protein